MTPPAAEGSQLSLERIREAAEVVDPVFLRTPQFVSDELSDRLGLQVLCKVETANPVRSFKGRGADYLVHRLGQAEAALACASAGNFGQGLAYAARSYDLPLHVFAAETANPLKVERMRRLGAQVHLAGADFDTAKDIARRQAGEQGWTYVEDGREPAIAEGAGTIAVELAAWPERLDAVLVPVGNGALINGVGRWLKAMAPGLRVVGACAERAPSMERSWRQRRMVVMEHADTIADGIAVRAPVPEALAEMAHTVDDMVLVSDEQIVTAMRLAFRGLGLVIEPAGAAGLAAALALRHRLAGKLVAVPLCGGNLTPAQIRRWLTD
ncbi:MAG: pyridoxal-phosphate dependent enzyme [Nitriliruptorales bacterium]|nr:pyridoxal-phosphate dependent enzyme [Nitriliruptorales bacterium]